MLTLRAGIQEIPPDHRGGYELQRDEIEFTAESYQDARALIYDEVERNRSGWRVIYLQTGVS